MNSQSLSFRMSNMEPSWNDDLSIVENIQIIRFHLHNNIQDSNISCIEHWKVWKNVTISDEWTPLLLDRIWRKIKQTYQMENEEKKVMNMENEEKVKMEKKIENIYFKDQECFQEPSFIYSWSWHQLLWFLNLTCNDKDCFTKRMEIIHKKEENMKDWSTWNRMQHTKESCTCQLKIQKAFASVVQKGMKMYITETKMQQLHVLKMLKTWKMDNDHTKGSMHILLLFSAATQNDNVEISSLAQDALTTWKDTVDWKQVMTYLPEMPSVLILPCLISLVNCLENKVVQEMSLSWVYSLLMLDGVVVQTEGSQHAMLMLVIKLSTLFSWDQHLQALYVITNDFTTMTDIRSKFLSIGLSHVKSSSTVKESLRPLMIPLCNALVASLTTVDDEGVTALSGYIQCLQFLTERLYTVEEPTTETPWLSSVVHVTLLLTVRTRNEGPSWSVLKTTSQSLLSSLVCLAKQNNESSFWNRMIFPILTAFTSRHTIQKEQWISSENNDVMLDRNAFLWYMSQMVFPHLTHDERSLGLVLSLTLPLIESEVEIIQLSGLETLLHVLKHSTATQITWYAPLLLHVLEKTLYTQKRENLQTVLYCICTSAQLLGTVVHTRFIPRLLQDCTLCLSPELQGMYLNSLRTLLPAISPPQDLTLFRYVSSILHVIEGCVHRCHVQLLTSSLLLLLDVITMAWPIMHLHTDLVISIVLRVMYFSSMKKATVTEGTMSLMTASSTTNLDSISKQILLRLEILFPHLNVMGKLQEASLSSPSLKSLCIHLSSALA